jgi:hypothetical protein
MLHRTLKLMVAFAAVLAVAATGTASVIGIGGAGAISTDDTYGSLGLLSGGETATATLAFVVTCDTSTATLNLTVTNTSPAVLGTDALTVPDAPVISDIFFSVPTVIAGMSLTGVDDASPTGTGWVFTYLQNSEPDTGFGFLKSQFDDWLDGGPPNDPAPVIASENDPDITDGPGVPMASPVKFTFLLTFSGGTVPAGFCATDFFDEDALGNPKYLAAAKFMSGANGGSATVTGLEVSDPPPTVPLPPAVVLGALGLACAWASRRRS